MTKKQLRQDITMLITAVFSLLTLGAVVFSVSEGWNLLDSFYFATMTATTVGYGDFVPTTHASKVMIIIYALSIIPFVLYAFSFVAKAQMNKVYTKIHHLERKQKVQEEEIDAAERKIKRQKSKIKAQEEAIEKHEKEIKRNERKVSKEAKLNKEQEAELIAVENKMEKALKK